MAYTAKTNDGSERDLEDQRSDINNAETIKNVADVAIASGDPTAATIGHVVNVADDLTHGKSTELLGKALTNANKNTLFGKPIQKGINYINESGIGDKAAQAASLSNQASGQGGSKGLSKAGEAASKSADTATNPEVDVKVNNTKKIDSPNSSISSNNTLEDDNKKNKAKSNKNDNNKEEDINVSSGGMSNVLKAILLLGSPITTVVIFAIMCGLIYSNFIDGLGAGFVNDEGIGGFVSFDVNDKESKEFFERIHEVKLEYNNNNKNFDSIIVVSVYKAFNEENGNFTYNKLTKKRIREIVDYSFDENFNYNEEIFYNNLKDHLIFKYFPLIRKENREEIAKNIVDYIKDYKAFLGNSFSECLPANSCSYSVNGFYYPDGKGNKFLKNSLQFKDLKVRLMQTGSVEGHNFGGDFGFPLDNEELIPFEEYILGVTYLEMGENYPEEALKAQMVAARSLALSTLGLKDKWRNIKKDKDGNYILQIANSSLDQRFCNTKLGCSSNDFTYGQIYSGLNNGKYTKKALSTNSILPSINSKVLGEVLINEDGNIVNTKYNKDTKQKFIDLANKGYDYKQILLDVYNNSKNDNFSVHNNYCTTTGTSGCTSQLSSGPYSTWKQYSGGWENILIGKSNKTIKQIGCAATSTAILIAKSNTQTNIDLNPGTFVETLNKHNGFGTGKCLGCINWSSVSSVAPNFRYSGSVSVIDYSISEKYNKLKNLLDNGYYVVAEVMGNTGEHWVAIDGVSNNNIIMMDPGSTSTNMWKTYPAINTSRYVYFKVI